jgi:hypothetical protein
MDMKEHLTVKLRAVDGSWSMGEDWEIQVDGTATLEYLRRFVFYNRGIPSNRQNYALTSGIDYNPIPPSKDKWTLKRIGVCNGDVLRVSPTPSGSWTWHAKEHYVRQLIDAILAFVDACGGRALLSEVEKHLKKVPALPEPIMVLARLHPESITVCADTAMQEIVFTRAKVGSLPTEGANLA